ncbi:glycosyltransferase [Atopococcus tabaci]|uniref:glycosyltransferase n=1 Tax=Atopococcus tabaci TaxID=269774 RepID=UPI00040351D0|nr:glycosyltransferase [Atopococcus tabaci]
MIRILHIGMTPNYGGLESFIMNVYRNVDRKKIQFDFLAPVNQEIAFEDEIIKMGGRVFHFIEDRKSGNRIIKPRLNFFKKTNYQIVHCHRTHLGDLDYLWAAKIGGVPIRIIHAHSTGYINTHHRLATIIERINRIFLSSVSTNLLACSQDAGEWMFTNNNFKVIKNAINLNRFRFNEHKREQIREKFNIENDEVLLGHIGTFYEVKNQQFLLEVLKELKYSQKKYKLMLVGDGKLKTHIMKKVTEYDLEKSVIFTGMQQNVEDFMNAFDIFLFPSKFEGLGTSVIEAQANGLPVLISDRLPQEVNIAENLYRLPIINSEKWVKLIERVSLKRMYNKELLRKNGYEIKLMSQELINYYTKLLGNIE